jgi:transcriptional regulator with XRE-family HTH domain
MTPFGEKVRQLRQARGVTQKQMAEALGVSAAWLSALENGRRGRPNWDFLQRVIAYFNVIWDEADELHRLARASHPRVTVDTSGLSANATLFANLVAEHVGELSEADLEELLHALRAKVAQSGK